MKNIAVVGTGYVGLVTGTCFAENGNNVTCIDIDENKVNQMKKGVIPIYEPRLDVLFRRNLKANRLHFTTSLEEGIKNAEIIFLALPTPPGEDGSADLSYIIGVGKELGKIIKKYKVIVDKSTVPVGTSEKVKVAIAEHCTAPFDVVSNPEFLREGFAVDDFLKPERVIIGTTSEKARQIMKQLYKPFVRSGNTILFMDERSAELTKYAANSFLATKITFMNEVANFCEKVGADVDMVRMGMGTDSRIGKRFLFPGIGYGGSCFPKDVQALVKSGKDAQFNFEILSSVMNINEKQKTILMPKIKAYFNGNLKSKHFAIWGLSFKPNTDDIREAPSIYMIDALLDAGAEITAYDPEAIENVKKLYARSNEINFAHNEYDALKDKDALIICTEWSAFRNPDFKRMGNLLKNNVIFDGRNLFEIKQMDNNGFYYESVGRKTVGNGK